MDFSRIKTITPAMTGFALAVSSLFLSHHAHAQNFYKWVDKNGSTHYTVTPPPANAKRVGNVATYNDTPRYTSAPQQAAPAEQAPQEQAPEAQPTPAQQPSNVEVPSTNHIPLPPVTSDPTAGQRL